MQNSNKNTTNYLVRFRNSQKVNEVYNGRLVSRGVQEHVIKILYPLNETDFDALSDNGKM